MHKNIFKILNQYILAALVVLCNIHVLPYLRFLMRIKLELPCPSHFAADGLSASVELLSGTHD
jgi:hypothetical protein